MAEQWRIRVRGKQRKHISAELLVAAIMALGEQWHAEQRDQAQATTEPDKSINPATAEARS